MEPVEEGGNDPFEQLVNDVKMLFIYYSGHVTFLVLVQQALRVLEN